MCWWSSSCVKGRISRTEPKSGFSVNARPKILWKASFNTKKRNMKNSLSWKSTGTAFNAQATWTKLFTYWKLHVWAIPTRRSSTKSVSTNSASCSMLKRISSAKFRESSGNRLAVRDQLMHRAYTISTMKDLSWLTIWEESNAVTKWE